MKYVNQLDYPHLQYITQTANPDPKWRQIGLENTIAKSGCGLCTSVMIADLLRVDEGDFEIEDARQLSYDCGANQWSGTRGIVYFPAFAEKFNLELVQSSNIEDLLHCLRTGEEVESPLEDGVTVQRMLQGIYDSARLGREVEI